MANFFLDNLDGSGTLDAHTSDVGVLTAPEVDFDDGSEFYNPTANPGLASFALNGSGAALFDTSVGDQVPILKLPPSPDPDYFVEVEFEIEFGTADFDVLIAVRASADSSWTDAVNYVGAVFYLYGPSPNLVMYPYYADSGSTGNGSGYTDPADYSAGRTTFTLRVEVSSTTLNYYINGAVVKTIDIATLTPVSPHFIAAGDAYVAFNFTNQTASMIGDLANVPISLIRAGTLGGGVFWQDFVGTREVDV